MIDPLSSGTDRQRTTDSLSECSPERTVETVMCPHGFNRLVMEALGQHCAECEDDREPPEPDGECFRGGEYASALAEEQAWIQRNLK